MASMTVEEVINYVVQERDAYVEVCKEWEALDEAIQALEKQIPKKPNEGHCPLCGEMLFWEGRVLLPTCPCGQKIKWSKE